MSDRTPDLNSTVGILLAGGNGTRLRPLSLGANKHLLPVYDKPLIYYSLSNLLLAGIRRVICVVRPQDVDAFHSLFSGFESLGISIEIAQQQQPDGIAAALKEVGQMIEGRSVVLGLGDNFFHGSGFTQTLNRAIQGDAGATVLVKEVADPSAFGVAELGSSNRVVRIVEKPSYFVSNFAVTGLYFLDSSAVEFALRTKESHRGEFEIADLLNQYAEKGDLNYLALPRATVWKDAGTTQSLFETGNYVSAIQELTGELVGSPEEIAWRKGWASQVSLRERAILIGGSYGLALNRLASGSLD